MPRLPLGVSMTLTESRKEIYRWRLEHEDLEMLKLAQPWKAVGDMMEAGRSAEEVFDVLVHRQQRALGKMIEKIDLKQS